MFQHLLPVEILQSIINDLTIIEASNLSITNTENKQIIKELFKGNMTRIRCSLKDWNITFPNAIYANIRDRLNINDSDFEYLSKVKKLNMSLCKQKSITDDSFRFLTQIDDLNLQGACGHWTGGHHFTDRIFYYLKDLKSFYIDNNHKITNHISSLRCIVDLTIHNCSNISDDGISNLITLKRLNIYNLHSLTDNAFINLTNLEDLNMTFGNISDIGISYLTNIKKLHFLSCKNIKCKNYDRLLKLNEISMYGNALFDDDIKSLSNIKNISLYGCSITGYGLKYLNNAKIISIYESPIIDNELDNLYKLNNLIQINIFRCRGISLKKKNELISVFGNKLNTDKY